DVAHTESRSGHVSNKFLAPISRKKPTHLKSTREGVKQNSKEKQCSTRIETAGSGLQVVEDTSNNQCHDEVTDKLTQSQTRIAFQTLETSNHAESDLFLNGHGVGRLDPLALCLHGFAGFSKFGHRLAAYRILLLIFVDLSHQLRIRLAVLPALSALIGRLRDPSFIALLHDTPSR